VCVMSQQMSTTDTDPPAQRPHLNGASQAQCPVSSVSLEYPSQWVSWRFTTPFAQRIQELFDRPDCTYIAVHEVSKKEQEHWHVITLGPGHQNRVKQHVHKSLNMSDKKNWWWSKKSSGTFEGALAYTMKTVDHSGNTRVLKSENWPPFEYKKWIFHAQPTIAQPGQDPEAPPAKKAKLDRDWQLTYSNLVCQAVKFHHEHGMSADCTLKECVKRMMKETKWRPCHQMYKCGVLPAFEEDFRFRIGQTKEPFMGWWRPSFSGPS